MTDPTPHAALRGAVDLSSLVQRSQQPDSTAAPAPADGSVVFATDDQGFASALELSRTVPVVVAVWGSWSEPSQELVAALDHLVRARAGRLVLATADADRSPQLVQAFQVQSVPTVVAVVAGQPVPLFAGVQPDEVIDQVFDQLLELASQHGVTGSVEATDAAGDPDAAPQEPEEPPLPPLHQEAYDAIEGGDFAAAAAAYKKAIAQDPRDQMAVAGLAQANLLGRLNGKTLESIRNAAAAGPDDLGAQLDVADLDLSGGHVDDAFDRLLTMFPKLDADQKKFVRERLVELFEVVGTEDPRVAVARRRLTNMLF
ncbi:co-chaperone YbbN [Agromyces sp. NPDC058110]|uniref:co-chaperone YbbN n=1 Tax=Agromyces sp. NPDC058110 TaxID=3346345 RepID=UPI0036DBBED4